MPVFSVIGTAVDGYRILAPLGVGATGAVYLAEHPLLGRRVAVKILHPGRAADGEATRTFLDDAEAVRDLDHPLVVSIQGVSTVETAAGPLPCVISELIEGRTLGELLADDGPLAPARAVVIAEQVAEALAAAHARGLVHGALKAENVFIAGGRAYLDEVKVLDFGTWRFGQPRGQAGYLAPEQCAGDDASEQSDVYALGTLLFEMLTARLPCEGGPGDLVIAHLLKKVPVPSEVRPGLPAALDAIVARALEARPERRFASMSELLGALRDPSSYLAPAAPEPIAPAAPAPAPVLAPETPRARRRDRRAPALLGLVAVVCVGIASAVLAAGAPQRSAPATAAAAPSPTVILQIQSCVEDAHVFLDGVEAGRPGAPLRVARGKPIEVSVRAPGHVSATRTVTPEADTRLIVVLVPRPAGPSIL
jgi:hypothetical protein